MQTVMRVILSVSLLNIIFSVTGHDAFKAEPALREASVAKQTCDRACLRGFMTKYLDALVAHDPGDLPVSAWISA
jgi:hypothetical protein